MQNEIKYIFSKNYIEYEPRRVGDWLLYQVGRRYCAEGSRVLPHRHGEYFELTVIIGGKGIASVDGEEVAVCEGDIHLSLPGDVHAITSDATDPLRYDFISLWPSGERLGAVTDCIAYARATGRRVVRDARISRLLTYAIDEVNSTDGGEEEALSAIVELIYVYLARALPGGDEGRRVSVGYAEQLCYRVMSYIDRHVLSLRSLREVAEAMSYNYGYLSGLFGRTTGRTMMEYYTERRLATADALLRSGLSVGEVAARVGYSSPYTLSRAYSARFGYPPSRAKNTQKSDPV